MKLLKKLTSIAGASSDELQIKFFLLKYILENQNNWKSKPTIIEGDEFHDNLILVFGKPRTAIYAHIDTIGFSVSYENQLVKIGGPDLIDETPLVGRDSKGKIETYYTQSSDYHFHDSTGYEGQVIVSERTSYHKLRIRVANLRYAS